MFLKTGSTDLAVTQDAVVKMQVGKTSTWFDEFLETKAVLENMTLLNACYTERIYFGQFEWTCAGHNLFGKV